MNYYERYPGDYQRDTAHLSLAEHGAYTMLLDIYYGNETALPADYPSLYRLCRAMDHTEQAAVRSVVDQFFPVDGDGHRRNPRVEREIIKARDRIETARANGRKGGRPANKEPGKNPAGIPAGIPSPNPEHNPEAKLNVTQKKAHQTPDPRPQAGKSKPTRTSAPGFSSEYRTGGQA